MHSPQRKQRLTGCTVLIFKNKRPIPLSTARIHRRSTKEEKFCPSFHFPFFLLCFGAPVERTKNVEKKGNSKRKTSQSRKAESLSNGKRLHLILASPLGEAVSLCIPFSMSIQLTIKRLPLKVLRSKTSPESMLCFWGVPGGSHRLSPWRQGELARSA